MSFQRFGKISVASLFAAVCIFGSSAAAQTPLSVGGELTRRPMRVAEGNNVQCAGYVTSSPIDTSSRLVGGWNEQDGWLYAQGQLVYLNTAGAKVGDRFAVVRPRGKVNTKWSSKGSLGMYVQEVGSVEVVRVNGDHSVAKVHRSCDNFLLGDVVRPMETREVPMYVQRPALDVFADSSGKAKGRLFMARDQREALSKDQIVYIDLGSEDNVQVGDYVTVFRPIGKGNIVGDETANESVPTGVSDYGSSHYKGGGFSNQSYRKSGDNADGAAMTTGKAKAGRPDMRKVVGELVVLNVKERTATAVIVRNAQEIHPGDWVEIQ
ncbi:MAG: hypothetical protein PSX80_03560 [bacterium]|nr:hypothetical protein [bacterium]